MSSDRRRTFTAKPRETWGRALDKNQRKISLPRRAVPAVITDPTRYANGTLTGTEEILGGHVAKLASMCTLDPSLLRPPVRPSPPSLAVDTSSQHASTTPSEAKKRPPSTDEDPKTYVVEALTGHRPGTDGMPLFRVRWYGYAREDDTWEPANYIDYNTVVRYCNRTRLPPPNIELWSAPKSVGVEN